MPKGPQKRSADVIGRPSTLRRSRGLTLTHHNVSGPKGSGLGAAEGLHVEEFIAAETRRKIGWRSALGVAADSNVQLSLRRDVFPSALAGRSPPLWSFWWCRGRRIYFHGGRRTVVKTQPISEKDENTGPHEGDQIRPHSDMPRR